MTDESVKTADPTASGEGGPNGSSGRSPVGEAPATTTTVYQAIAAVIEQLPPLPKDQEGPKEQGRYAYRGIEAIKAAAQQLMAKAGVVYAPRAKIITVDPAPPNAAKGWQDWTVEFTWVIRGPAGDRFKPAPVTIGVGRDNSDKGVNKAQSQAEKYMLNALLQIADPTVPEPDQHGDYGAQMTDEQRRAEQAAAQPNEWVDDATRARLQADIKALPEAARQALAAEWIAEDPMTGAPFLPLNPETGKPAVGRLFKTMVPAVEALILRSRKGIEPAKDEQAQSLADRAASHGRQKPQEAPAAAEPDATPAEPAGDPQPGDPAWVVPGEFGVDLGGRDLADVPIAELAGEVRAVGAMLPSSWVTELTEAVSKLHQSRVDREMTAQPGQTKGDGEDIQHRRLRVSLVRMMAERARLADAEAGRRADG